MEIGKYVKINSNDYPESDPRFIEQLNKLGISGNSPRLKEFINSLVTSCNVCGTSECMSLYFTLKYNGVLTSFDFVATHGAERGELIAYSYPNIEKYLRNIKPEWNAGLMIVTDKSDIPATTLSLMTK